MRINRMTASLMTGLVKLHIESEVSRIVNQHIDECINKYAVNTAVTEFLARMRDREIEVTVLPVKNLRAARRRKGSAALLDMKKCMARVQKGAQCSRLALLSGEYCKAHSKARPHGRIDEPQFKNGQIAKLIEENIDQYIIGRIITIDGKKYIQDERDLLLDYKTLTIEAYVDDEGEPEFL